MIRLTKWLFLSSAIVLATTGVMGCTSGYNHVEITDVSQGDLTTAVSLQAITIPVGGIAIAHVIPYNSDHNPMVGVVNSDHLEVLLVEGAQDNKWAFSGVKAGTSTVTFLADGAIVATVVAKVEIQGN